MKRDEEYVSGVHEAIVRLKIAVLAARNAGLDVNLEYTTFDHYLFSHSGQDDTGLIVSRRYTVDRWEKSYT